MSPPAANMLRMKWNDDLQNYAESYLKKCVYEHSPKEARKHGKVGGFAYVGENLYVTTALTDANSSLVDASVRWAAEVSDWTYPTQCRAPPCGHYTQQVWATSYDVGCGVQRCDRIVKFGYERGQLVSCVYGDGGNYPGPPYVEGAFGSKCPEGRECLDGLSWKWEQKNNFGVMFLLVVLLNVVVGGLCGLAYYKREFLIQTFRGGNTESSNHPQQQQRTSLPKA